MTRLPRVTGQKLLVALRKAGFEVIRIKGSHHFLRHPDGRSTVIPSIEVKRWDLGLRRKFSKTAS